MGERHAITVKELREKIAEFPDSLVIMIPNTNWNPNGSQIEYVPATSVSRGVNEYDCFVFVDDYTEE